ncbi:hypothetical protein O0L34_g13440 [Tuta absoluta]|nr:hypothetical protein O0L34_g13440 [Tuta absoluta]
MRVLILPAILAVALAAPSGELKDAAPLAVLPVVTPTIDPGDIQAAAINAQVAAEDQARAFADKIVEENNEKVIESDSLVKEKTEENFWAVEDKKWQALDAVQTAAAKIDGAVASNADAIARSALGGVIVPAFVAPSLIPAPVVRAPIVPGAPFIPPGLPLYTSPVIAPISPLLYNPALIAKKEDEKEKLVKTAELQKDIKVESYSGIVNTYNLYPPSVYVPSNITKTDEDTKEIEKDKQIIYTIYRTQAISPATLLYYNPNINIKENFKETKVEKANTTEPEKDNNQVILYPTSLFTAPVIHVSTFYTPAIIAKTKTDKPAKDNEIENNAENDKEDNKFEEKKEEKPLEKGDKDKLEKPLGPLVPLVAPQPWPLSPVAPVYVPQQVLTHW